MESFKYTIRLLRPVAIYALLDSAGAVRWIGKTENAKARLARHSHERPWVRSFFVVEWATETDWEDRERHWISLGRSLGWPLENKAQGGQGGTSGWHHTKEVIEKIRAAKKTHRNSPEAAARAAATRKANGYQASPETIARMSASLRGRKVSTETALKISAAKKANCQDPVYRAAISVRMKAWWAARRRATGGNSCLT